jgi:2-methylcitrate dehydratase PrpD
MTMTDLSAEFAAQMLAIDAAALTSADRDQLGRLLFDVAACAYGGTRQSTVEALVRWAQPYAGAGKCGVVGAGFRVPAPVAALVNGTAAHSYELDDTHDPSMSHPASVVVPAALVVAEECGSTGGEFIAAIVAGYEAMARIGMAANASRVIEFGLHPTALFGGFGAAAAAARLRRFDSARLLCAWGHVLSMASGSMQFSDETTGTAVKRVHAGYAAQQGVLAAELSQAGVQAPQHSLDGKYGFLKLYGRETRPELLLERPPRLAIHDISFKPYACCRQFHSVIDGLRTVTGDFADVRAIKGIKVRGPRVLADQHMLRRPSSPMAAQYSLPFVVGATLELGPARYDAFATENLANPAILHWADMVEVGFDDEMQAQYPAHFGSEVEVAFVEGAVRTERVLDSRGTPARPLTWGQLHEKASALTAQCRPPLDLALLREMVGSLARAESIEAFARLLAGQSPAAAAGVPRSTARRA